MKFNPDIHNRKSIRLKWYDYTNEWLYFITISVKNKLSLFWNIENDEINLNLSWKMIEKYWLELENKFKNIKLHNFIVMPNHFHWIIEIINDNDKLWWIDNLKLKWSHDLKLGWVPDLKSGWPHRVTPTGGKFIFDKKSISSIIGWFKTMTTNKYIKMVYEWKANPFNKKLWQVDFYEHIIRNEKSYIKISEYIEKNPIKWKEDKFYYTEI